MNKKIDVFYDGVIIAGQDWRKELKTKLLEAEVIICLVSKNYYASEYIHSKEIIDIQARLKANLCKVVPVIVSQCLWEENKFIETKQVLPSNQYTPHP